MDTIDKIRLALYDVGFGFTNRDISVRYAGDAIIHVTTKRPGIKDWVKKKVTEIYQSEPHYWLMVKVDGEYLPLHGSNIAIKKPQPSQSGQGELR